MKKLLLTIVLSVVAGTFAFAQRFAYVDSEFILENIPEYNDAMKQIDDLSIKWQQEIEAKFQEIDNLYKKFQVDAPLLTEEMKQKRENEIITKEKEAKDMQKKRFGTNGDLFKKRQELLRPIQDKVYDAIAKRAAERNYVFVFDRADNANILYADTKVDISNDILDDLGYKVSKKKMLEITPTIEQSQSDKSKSVNIDNSNKK